MKSSSVMERATIGGAGGALTAWTGGQGDALLLIHGGWGGAASHWSAVWDQLAASFRVIAPELPGFGDGTPPGPRTYGQYARWVERLMDAMSVQAAWLVGNSFGGMVAWRLASQTPERCLGLVMVNSSLPPPPLSRRARWMVANTPLGPLRRSVVRAILRRIGYGPSVLERAFLDPGRAPLEVANRILQRSPPQVELALDALLGDDEPCSPPRAPLLLLWGAADRGFGTNPGVARRIQRSMPGSQIAWIESAGHLPQVDRPTEFVEALTRFVHETRGRNGLGRKAG